MKTNRDSKTVSEFRAHATELIEQVKNSKRPLVLTEHGHSEAVILDMAEYERMVEEIELLGDVHVAMQQIERGEGVSNREAKAELRRRFGG